MFNNFEDKSYPPFCFEFITELIIRTQRNKYKIQKEWKKIQRFLELFPEYEKTKISDDCYDLKSEFLVDSFQKVYKQILTSQKETIEQGYFNLYYYEYDESLTERWELENVELGDCDSTGLLNTGCCIVLKYVQVDIQVFENQYFGICN